VLRLAASLCHRARAAICGLGPLRRLMPPSAKTPTPPFIAGLAVFRHISFYFYLSRNALGSGLV